MADPSRDPYSKPDTTRRWLKVFVIVLLIIVALVVVMMLVGGHTPRPH